MTVAERVRRHRLNRKPAPVTKHVTEPNAAESAAVAALAARVRELEAETATLRQQNAELRAQLQRPTKPAMPATPKPQPRPAPDQEAKLRAQVRDLRRQLRLIRDASKGALVISKADRTKIRRCLHPDVTTDPAMQKRLTEASQIFNGLKMVEVETD